MHLLPKKAIIQLMIIIVAFQIINKPLIKINNQIMFQVIINLYINVLFR